MNKTGFIKIADQDFAEQLVKLGFQYIKECDNIVFVETDELLDLLQTKYSQFQFVKTNRLTF